MRAGPLSNDKVIRLLNGCFIPVYASNEDEKTCSRGEQADRRRIYLEALNAKMSAGSVCLYILAPDGHVMDSKTVPNLAKVTEMLESAIQTLQLKETKPVLKPAPQYAAPKAAADELVLHLAAPYEQRHGSWHDVPAESWIVLSKPEWTRLLPPGKSGELGEIKTGQSWEIDKTLTTRLYNYFYPATEDTVGDQIGRNMIKFQSLSATVISVTGPIVRARLEGSLKMNRPFYPHHPELKIPEVSATITGYMEFEPGKEIRWLKLVTPQATYGDSKFGVAVTSEEKVVMRDDIDLFGQ